MILVKFLLLFVLETLMINGAIDNCSDSLNYPTFNWTYYNDCTGPAYWDKISPAYCSLKTQSPINLRYADAIYDTHLRSPILSRVNESQSFGIYKIKNSGHGVTVVFPDKQWQISFPEIEQVDYVAQFHWHWGTSKSKPGSEHAINGKHYDMEGHLVTFNQLFTGYTSPESILLIFGMMYEETETYEDKIMDSITKTFDNADLAKVNGEVEIDGFDIRELLPRSTARFFRYSGSLTTPPCHQNAVWTVFETAKSVSSSNLKKFRDLLKDKKGNPAGDNIRPLQELHPNAADQARRSLTVSFKVPTSLNAGIRVSVGGGILVWIMAVVVIFQY